MIDGSTHSADAVFAEPAEAHPRRYRWMVRIAALYVLIAAAVAGVRWGWGDVAERRLAAAIGAAHAGGEKIVVADYARADALPDEHNGAFHLLRAEQSLKLSRTEDWSIHNATVLPLREDIFLFVTQALQNNAAALSDIRTARELGKADWGVNVSGMMWATLLPHLNPARRLAGLSRAASLHAAQRGDHIAAVEHIRDIQAIAAGLDDGNMFAITHLVRIGIEVLAADAVAELARDLQVVGAMVDATTQPAHAPASREQVRELIASLLDDGPRRASLQAALQGERAEQVDVGINVAGRTWIVRPSIQLDTLGLIKEGQQIMTAGAAPDWPTARKLLPVTPTIDGPRRAAHVVSESVRPALSRAISNSHRATTQSRLAALALAIRLYQLDHDAQRPPTLEALVPDYLPAVPLDPYAAGGKPLGYVPDRVAPYVYSVGENGIDDSARASAWRPDEKTIDPLTAPDLFLRLTKENAPAPQVIDPPVENPEPTTTSNSEPPPK